MQIKNIFTNILAVDYIDIDNETVIKYIYGLMKNSPGRSISNQLGWQSNSVDYAVELEPLILEIEKRLRSLYDSLGFKKDRNIKIDSVWLNVNKPLSSNSPHRHEGLFSGVYYLNGTKDSGEIVFMSPIDCHELTINPEMYEKNNEFNSATWHEEPRAGKLIIFPSWLTHYVKPNLSDSDRISIAFNASFV
jgi:uncharacterized protein (TIGR02466 family)